MLDEYLHLAAPRPCIKGVGYVTRPQEIYQHWLQHPYFDAATRQELQSIAADSSEIDDRFYRSLQFGTGGLRGLIGAGTNRINQYTVRQATQGLATYIHTFGAEALRRGVVIAHDSRRFAPEFAKEAALTLNASGVRAYLWDSLRPTPMLSFAVRELGAIAGIVITASHNPPQYNGYKVYWEDGGQIPPERAAAIEKAISACGDITSIVPLPEDEARAKGLLCAVPERVDLVYLDKLLCLTSTGLEQRRDCRILYTPLHGAGNRPVREVLARAGFQVTVVPEQELPDGEFPTVSYPNPEEPSVFSLALGMAETLRPDVIMATDPDADRLGVFARDEEGRYGALTGNQIGAILVEYVLSSRKARGTLPTNGAVVKTIATSNMVAELCRQYGVTLLETHTGFKFIGDKIRDFEETGSHTFLLGYEESYGYLGADFVRDKDAVMAALLVAEATAYYKSQGQTLFAVLHRIWQQCGCFLEDLYNVSLPGQAGQAQIAAIISDLRRRPPTGFAGIPVDAVEDYEAGSGIRCATGETYPLTLGKANVLQYRFRDGGFVMVRPSGTEPKLKVYVSVCGSGRDEAEERLAALKDDVLRRMKLL